MYKDQSAEPDKVARGEEIQDMAVELLPPILLPPDALPPTIPTLPSLQATSGPEVSKLEKAEVGIGRRVGQRVALPDIVATTFPRMPCLGADGQELPSKNN